MNILFFVQHPVDPLITLHIANNLEKNGNSIYYAVMERENSIAKILRVYGLKYTIVGSTKTKMLLKSLNTLRIDYKLYNLMKIIKPNIVFSPLSPYPGHICSILDIPCIGWEDTETAWMTQLMSFPFYNRIVTPNCYLGYIPKFKHIPIRGYKELAYLHPNYFTPNPKILEQLHLEKNEKYVIFRFNSYDASHDIGITHFSAQDKLFLIKEVLQECKIFISSELPLPPNLRQYEIKLLPNDMHNALYYASLLISGTGTMTTEAAVLGTPAIINHPLSLKIGNFVELEKRYGLIFNIRNKMQILKTALRLIRDSEIKNEWQQKRQIMLQNTIDVAHYFTQLIINNSRT